nr:conserved oligomeric Golgi complex subunit 8-like [Dermatophagoides farinae]
MSTMATIPLSISLDSMATNSNNLTSTTTSSSSSSSSNRGKWSAATIGTIISAPIRGYYYPGRVKAIKKTLPPTPTTTPTTTTTTTNTTNTSNSMLPKDLSPSSSDNHANNQQQQQQLTTNNANNNNNNNGQLIYSIQFTNPLDSYTFDWMDELGNGNGNDQQPNDNQSTANNTNTTTVTTAKDQGLILDYTADQLIGRGFEPITRALLSENQKVFITYRNRECSAHVLKHDTDTDDVTLVIDQQPQEIRIVRLNEIRLLPSRKSARIQEHPDYSLLASNGRRSPDDNLEMNQSSKSSSTMNKSKQSRQRNQSGSSILLTNNSNNGEIQNNGFRMNHHHHQHQQSAHIDVPQQQKLNRFGHSFNQNNSNNIGAM